MKILECGVWFGPVLDVRRFVDAIRCRDADADAARCLRQRRLARAALAAERLPSCVTLAICSNSFHTALQALFILRISISNDSFEAGQEDAMWRCPVHSNTMNWSYRLNSC